MYPHFIEVHDKEEGYPILLNIECINKVYLDGNSDMSDTWGLIIMKHGNVTTIESYDEVQQLIEDAGCSINRADPRIDSRSSLTMNQIMRILGEPVWNSNLNQWALVHYYNPDNDTIQLMNPGGKIYIMTEEEMIRFPLYRTKGAEQ